MFEMVYPFLPRYTKSATYTHGFFRRPRINSFGSPLEVCIPDTNIIFQTSRTTHEHVLLSKFKKLWLVTSKMSNRETGYRSSEI